MDKKEIKEIVFFIAIAWISSIGIFEEGTRWITQMIIHLPGASHIWEVPGWPHLIFAWYLLIFLVAYYLFRKKPIWQAVVFGIVVGMLAETFLFKKMNIVSFFIFPFLYGGMFLLPFWALKKWKLYINEKQ